MVLSAGVEPAEKQGLSLPRLPVAPRQYSPLFFCTPGLRMETAGGIEPPFAGLQPVAFPLGYAVKWSEWGDSNALPRGPRPRALPDELHPDMAAADGVEPPSPGSEPGVLPMYYAAIWRLVQGLNLRPSG